MASLARRLLTVPAYLGLAAGSLATAPIWLGVLGCMDLVRRRRLASPRCGAVFTLVFACEAAGILTSFWIWLVDGPWRRGTSERYLAKNFRLQCRWASTLLRGATRIFGMRLHVSGQDAIPATPLLLFLRHASVIDTMLPVVLVSAPYAIRLRYVLKRELLWDPCLDIVGQRLPNHFVDRDPGDSETEIDAVGHLADALGEGEGVAIYPEGTRFSPAKRTRVIARLRARGHAAEADRAQRLRRVLPPRPGGPLALLEHAPDTDVVFCAHTGFEGAAHLRDIWRGRLIGVAVRVHFWRVRAHDVPRETDARREWLFAQWETLDAWIAGRG